MLTYVYAHFPKLIITKAVIVMCMIAMVVLEVHSSSVRKPFKNQIVRTVRYGESHAHVAGLVATECATIYQSHLPRKCV